MTLQSVQSIFRDQPAPTLDEHTYFTTRWWFQMCFIFTPILGKMNPIWLAHIFQMGWFNHQLDYLFFFKYHLLQFALLSSMVATMKKLSRHGLSFAFLCVFRWTLETTPTTAFFDFFANDKEETKVEKVATDTWRNVETNGGHHLKCWNHIMIYRLVAAYDAKLLHNEKLWRN